MLQPLLRSLLSRIRTNYGFNQVPCGIEHLRVNQSKKYFDSLTRCMRLVQKEHNRRIKNCGMLKLYNLYTKWSDLRQQNAPA